MQDAEWCGIVATSFWIRVPQWVGIQQRVKEQVLTSVFEKKVSVSVPTFSTKSRSVEWNGLFIKRFKKSSILELTGASISIKEVNLVFLPLFRFPVRIVTTSLACLSVGG